MSKQSNVLSFQKAVKQKFNNEKEVTFTLDDENDESTEFVFSKDQLHYKSSLSLSTSISKVNSTESSL